MKVAMILEVNSLFWQQHLFEMNVQLEKLQDQIKHLELWLFSPKALPQEIPKTVRSLSSIRVISQPDQQNPESYLNLLKQLADQHPVDMMLFSSDGLGVELATRMAFRLNGSACLQVQSCLLEMEHLIVFKPVFGNNLLGQFVLNKKPYCISVNKTTGQSAEMIPIDHSITERIELTQANCDWIEELEEVFDSPDTGLNEADIVLVVGQGAKSKDNVKALHKISKSFGAEFGASRPVVMNAWTGMERLVGVSGASISPELCIAAGVSGSRVFSVGIENSELIIAINTDKHAQIFQMADVGVVGDMNEILIEIENLIKEDKLMPTIENGSEKIQ